MIDHLVRNYYASLGQREWLRLESPADGAVEFAITCHFLQHYLPQNARILDLGGGPGRYTIWLAQQGHRVTLVDLSPEQLAIAREKVEQAGLADSIEEITEGDARDLSRWLPDSFDAIVCLGPFYHMPDPPDRQKAALELNRVLRKDGFAFIALMPKFTFLRRTLAIPDERRHLIRTDFIESLLQDEAFFNDIPGRFTAGWGVDPADVNSYFDSYGFSPLTLVAAEGIMVGIQQVLVDLAKGDPDIYQAAFKIILKTANDPSILGMATHLLYVGRKYRSYENA